MRDIEDLHSEACSLGRDTYQDPQTGYTVMTSNYLRDRGYCCGSGCRHCPYMHARVRDPEKRTNHPTAPIIIPPGPRKVELRPSDSFDVLFFSGGKDSFLCYHELSQSPEPRPPLILLTTYDPKLGKSGIQNVPLSSTQDAAQALGLPLLVVPLIGASNVEYEESVEKGLQLLAPAKVNRLIFGDIHLADIRAWREEVFGKRYPCHFPLFGRSREDLMSALEAACEARRATIAISSVNHPALEQRVSIGDPYSRAWADELPEGVDPFGECGEFQTMVTIGKTKL